MPTAALLTRNPYWGFFGTISRLDLIPGVNADRAWAVAMRAIAAATGASPEGVRDFLDSRCGRHFADDVANALAEAGPDQIEAAIAAAIDRWQRCRIDWATSRAEGIPAGLPALTGWVGHFEILGERQA